MLQIRSRTALAVGFCSSAVLLTEMTLTRIFSVTLMYHYAFLVLSITLFGLGLGGIYHFLWDDLLKRADSPKALAFACSVALPTCLGLILRLPFSPQILSPANIIVLLIIVVLAAIHFFLAGLFVSLLYIRNRGNISRLYAYDLIGAAMGCVVAIYLIGIIGAPLTPLAASVLLLLSSGMAAAPDQKLGRGALVGILWLAF